MAPDLRTDRLRLRSVRPSDLDALHALVSDREVVSQTASWPWPADRAFTATRCEPMDPARGISGLVFLGECLVGVMGVHDTGENQGEMGYMFARAHWGKGFATEMGRVLIAHAFATYDWTKITACVFDGNPGSIRVLEKLGFAEAGPCVSDCKARGGVFPTRTFTLKRP
ncbi:GNAT family N-acetyltransferase [Aliiroseovarius sp.]|uniref:GNAT family N-acetyltransferase n=1 Tax=Aliiroseovarius sp. TaxID=1872442 RepID=UPI0026310F4F|nr:GNAT family N-acetyltransferase [Aliiroseovarius sp.]